MNDQKFLVEAIEEARKGLREGGLSIGSVLADRAGNVVARGYNLRCRRAMLPRPILIRLCSGPD